jgi:uncharacterized protein YkwD
MRFVAAITILAATGCASPTAPDALPVSPAAQAIASTVFDLTNLERTKGGLAPLAASSKLMLAAQLQSDQMAQLQNMNHVLPGAPYPNPVDRLAAANYQWQAYGENIAMGYATADEVVTAWMNSAGHRANILSTSFTELGVGYALDASGRPYYTQDFGHPAP